MLIQEKKRKQKKEKYRYISTRTFITLSLAIIALTTYALCYVCIYLYNVGKLEWYGVIIYGAMYIYIIYNFICLLLIKLKEIREENWL